MENADEKVKQPRRPKLVGVVSSAAGNKTIRVVVESLVKHPTYGKFLRTRTKLAVHDPSNTGAVGDTVEVTTCRRLSKTKSWRLVKVIRKANAEAQAPAQ